MDPLQSTHITRKSKASRFICPRGRILKNTLKNRIFKLNSSSSSEIPYFDLIDWSSRKKTIKWEKIAKKKSSFSWGISINDFNQNQLRSTGNSVYGFFHCCCCCCGFVNSAHYFSVRCPNSWLMIDD